ncbi:MAG: TIGR00159 family protein [Sphingobacteriaceae bacterium]|nr:TIGR00159 family protein [Cytophagaceae bacterium]
MTFALRVGFLDVSFIDLLDIALVAYLLYQIYFLIRDSIASRVFLGYLLVYGFYLVVRALGMELLSTILGQFMQIGVLALLVIFQPEIRRFLLLIGRSTNFQQSPLFRRFFGQKRAAEATWALQPLIEATKAMVSSRTGALVVVRKEDELKRYLESGTRLDAVLTKSLLLSIFNKTSPLHDGAVIIGDGRIQAARCVLPVSESDKTKPFMGFRHRAALGLAEHSDAAMVVVSEEKGEIAFAADGEMYRNLTIEELETRLVGYLTTAEVR